MMANPQTQPGLPILHFQMLFATYGALLKLRVQGAHNDRCSLTMIDSSSLLPKLYQQFYSYTLDVFPELEPTLLINPPIFESTQEKGGPGFVADVPQSDPVPAPVQLVVLEEAQGDAAEILPEEQED